MVRDAIAAVRAAGVTVIVATGRSPWGTVDVCRQLHLTGPQITMNGAVFGAPITGELVWARQLTPEELRSHLEFAAWLCVRPTVCLLDGYAIEKAGRESNRELPHFASGTRLRTVERLEEIAGAAPIRTFIPTAPSDEQFHAAVIRAARVRLGDRASIVWSDLEGIEMLRPGTNKGQALSRVAASLGIAREETVAIGDGPNDIEMLRFAARSAAMDNASAQVKAAATDIVPSSADDGAVAALRLFFPRLDLGSGESASGPAARNSDLGEDAA